MQKTVIAVLAAAAALSVSACNRTDNNTPRTAGTPAAESTNRPANPPANTTPQPGATNPDRAPGSAGAEPGTGTGAAPSGTGGTGSTTGSTGTTRP
jgi:hypothetical protein